MKLEIPMKKYMLILLALFAAAGLYAQKTYSVGDTGPGGGIVFYASPQGFAVEDGKGGVKICHYLEVSKEDLGTMTWCPTGNLAVELPVYEIGNGLSSSRKIADFPYYKVKPTGKNCAAVACLQYKTKTTKTGDWYLPTADELRLVFKNLTAEQLGCTHQDFYWSSSSEGNSAWARKSKTSSLESHATSHCVRAVHAF